MIQSCKKFAFPILSGLIIAFPLISPAQDAKPEDKEAICATVNGENVTDTMVISEIDDIVRENRRQLQSWQVAQKNVLFYEDALDRKINFMLIEQTAEKEGIKAEKAEIDEEMETAAADFPSQDVFQQTLAAQGLTEEKLRDFFEDKIIFEKLIAAKVPDATPVTEADVKTFYEENADQMTQQESVEASHILLSFDADASDEDKAKKKAELTQIRKDILDGKVTFEDAATKHSNDPGSAQNGGSLGEFPRGMMVKPFEEAAFSTPVGEITDIVESQFGVHIIKVTGKKEEKVMELDEVKDKIKEYLERQQKFASASAFVGDLRKAAKIDTLITPEEWSKMQAPNQSTPSVQLDLSDN